MSNILRHPRPLAAIVAFLLALSPFGGLHAMTAPPQIHVFSCQVLSGALVPQKDEVGLAVRFRNESGALRSIVWRAKYGKNDVDFIDDGMFSPDIRIDNYLLSEQGKTRLSLLGLVADTFMLARGAPGDVPLTTTSAVLPSYMGFKDPENCSIVRVTTQNGDTWINPALAQQSLALPARTPAPASPIATPMPLTDRKST